MNTITEQQIKSLSLLFFNEKTKEDNMNALIDFIKQLSEAQDREVIKAFEWAAKYYTIIQDNEYMNDNTGKSFTAQQLLEQYKLENYK